MARGWESKAVEAQQQEREAAHAARGGRPLTASEREAVQRRRTLELARARIVGDLQAAGSDRHRAMLRQALAAIDEHLRQLS